MSNQISEIGEKLNESGWTCNNGEHEPGHYQDCPECKYACDELAGFLLPMLSEAWEAGFATSVAGFPPEVNPYAPTPESFVPDPSEVREREARRAVTEGI